MSTLPQEPKFVTAVSQLQKILAGIAVSMAAAVWVSGFDWFQDIFKPNFINILGYIRVFLAGGGLISLSVVGYRQLGNILTWALDNYQLYRKAKKEIEGDK